MGIGQNISITGVWNKCQPSRVTLRDTTSVVEVAADVVETAGDTELEGQPEGN